MAGEKWCNDCKSSLSLDLFYKDKGSPDGKDYYCKDCRKKRKLSRSGQEKDYRRAYHEENRQKRLEYSVKFNRENKHYFSQWRDLNRDKTRAYSQKYRSQKLKATPPWLTSKHLEEIKSFHLHARDCELVSGEKYHVDHIIPLQGETICGLHVPWNLQVLPYDLNISKSNKFETQPDNL